MTRNPFDLLQEAYNADPTTDGGTLARRVLSQLTFKEIEQFARGALQDPDEPVDCYYTLAFEELITELACIRCSEREGKMQ